MIKRYDLINVPCHGGWDSYDELQEVEDGGWVRYDDHAAEVERLRAENDRLREDLAWMTAEAHAQREAAIYGAAWAENARFYNAKIIDPVECAAAASEAAEKAVEIWRAAQKGGSDG